MTAYTIHTDLDPEQLTNVAVEVYRHWLQFALGRVSIGSHYLKHPTGKYASALSWKKTGEYQVTIMADSSIAKEVESIETGAPAYDLKSAMLGRKSKIAADGHRYRVVKMPSYLDKDPGAGVMLNAGSLEDIIKTTSMGQSVKKSFAKIWGKRAARTKFRTMSDKPGAASWVIPARPAYAPAKILSDLLNREYNSNPVSWLG